MQISDNESWNIFIDECHILGIPTITRDLPAVKERPNINDIGIMVKDQKEIDINTLKENINRLKSNLISYKYDNHINKWQERWCLNGERTN